MCRGKAKVLDQQAAQTRKTGADDAEATLDVGPIDERDASIYAASVSITVDESEMIGARRTCRVE